MLDYALKEPPPPPMKNSDIVKTEDERAENVSSYPLYYYIIGGVLLGFLATRFK